jgi:hypothetical protein
MSGWMLTTEGRGRGETLLATELEAAGCREGVHSAYQEFLSVNHGFLELCTDWQLRAPTHDPTGEKVVNDHSDPDHDAAVIARLVEVNRVCSNRSRSNWRPCSTALTATVGVSGTHSGVSGPVTKTGSRSR